MSPVSAELLLQRLFKLLQNEYEYPLNYILRSGAQESPAMDGRMIMYAAGDRIETPDNVERVAELL